MGKHHVVVFEPFPFQAGQKIHIASGPRRGDWEVVALGEKKVTLRCPISLRVFEWDRFCYVVEERNDEEWPRRD